MSTASEIESAFRKLPPPEQYELIGRLEEICEDRFELSDEFGAKLARAEQQLADNLGRTRKPQG